MTTETEKNKNQLKKQPAVEVKDDLTAELAAVLEDIAEESEPAEKKKGETVQVLENDQLLIGDRQYKLATNYRDGFDAEKLGERFSDVLSRYDYIVGDWGYEQLRLKGFFANDNRRAFPDQRIESLQDYLYEYCNFGCAYFVIERVGGKRERKQNRRRRSNSGKKNTTTAHTEEKKAPVQSVKKTKPTIKNRKTEPKKQSNPAVKNTTEAAHGEKSGFVIRKRED